MKSFRGSNIEAYKRLVSRNYPEGRECDNDYINLSGLRDPFAHAQCLSFVRNLPNKIYPRHLQEFFSFYEFDQSKLTLNFKMYGHDYTWSLEKLGTVLNISSQGRLFYSDATNTNEFTKYNRYDSTDHAYINASEIQNTIFKRPYHCDGAPYHYWSTSHLQERLKMWELVLTSNVFVQIGSKGNLSVIVAKEEHLNPNHFITCKGVDPIFLTFNASTLELTDIEYSVPEHEASSSRGLQLYLEERIES
ncbi:hypothetical protein Tco_0980382 [Tanacetum coccineum]